MNTLKKSHTNNWRLFIILISVLLWSACTSEPAAPTPSLEPVTLQLQWITQAQFAGYYVALDKGWYQDEGIALTILPGAPDVIPVDRVASGSADFATTLLADLVVAVQEGKPVTSVAQIQQANGLLLIAKKSTGVSKPEDFEGKRVGVWLGSWEAQFNALIAQQNIPSDDFELVSQGFSMDPFLNNELDVASAMIYNEYHVVLESGVSPEDINIIDYADYGLDMPGDVLFTSQKMITDRPELVEGMVRATLRGWQYAIENPAEAVDIVLKYDETGLQTREHQLAMMSEIADLVQVTNVRPIGFTDESDINRVIDTLYNYGVLTELLPSTSVYNNEFWEKAQAGLNES